MNKEALAALFFRETEKIIINEALDESARIEGLYNLLNLLFVELTRREKIQFTTLFARITYACHQHQLEKQLQYYIHRFRKLAGAIRGGKTIDPHLFPFGIKLVTTCIETLLEEKPPANLNAKVPPTWSYPFSPVKVQTFRPKVRVLGLEDDKEHHQLLVRDEAHPEDTVRVQYNLSERNENFNPTIEVIRRIMGFPLVLNLLDVEIGEDGVYRPRAIVIEPDYLVDVSAVAECFRGQDADPWSYLLKKFLPFETTKYLMLGNIANFFLDELMNNPELTFKDLAAETFRLNPLAFCLFDNREIREIMQQSQRHFLHLKQMVKTGFKTQQIDPEQCFLEPTFYSETYGLQGRLDVFFHQEGPQERAAIVELKSGKPFMPNSYGISANHFTQTLLYDLLVRSAFGPKTDPANYILYSGQEERQLRYAPTIKAQQYEAIQVRNQLVGLEMLLAKLGTGEEPLLAQGQRLFGKLSTRSFPKLTGFAQRDLALFEKTFAGMSELQKKYFTVFSGFIAREHQLAKTGLQGVNSVNGLASLWLNRFEEKESNFDIISHLEILQNKAQGEEATLVFGRTERTHPLANFRKGDIAVLYPCQDGKSVLSNQVFKCSIIAIDRESVSVRLRSRQFNNSIFEAYELWNLEHDLLDSSFLGMYRGLFAFADAPPARQALLMTTRPPAQGPLSQLSNLGEMTPEQQLILRKTLAAPEYFLLWGPPGTGKTSVMLKHLVSHLLQQSGEQLLLLAYTNRAVDEICDAIEAIGPNIREQYLRIGSRYATADRFQEQLLNNKIEKLKTRKELQALLTSRRIIVGTVSSVSARPELLRLKTFDRVIIDEASQILEPMLVGLLPHFKRFILIGDHKQLPAVVTQSAEQSAVADPALNDIGLSNLRNSLFERLFKRCVAEQWHWAFAQLSHQGRMHREIMAFPNQHFYEGTLKILPAEIPAHLSQVEAIHFKTTSQSGELAELLCQKRMVFLPTPPDDTGNWQKTNRYEAALIGELVATVQTLYADNNRALSERSIGIITPYRAQIASIRQVLREKNIPLDLITIDTVERYQGGARDTILISLCTNSLHQIINLASLSDEGVDRKLNVALTRAREHLVIVGNPELLSLNPLYRQLLAYCGLSVPA